MYSKRAATKRKHRYSHPVRLQKRRPNQSKNKNNEAKYNNMEEYNKAKYNKTKYDKWRGTMVYQKFLNI
jgi:hypothetical protein